MEGESREAFERDRFGTAGPIETKFKRQLVLLDTIKQAQQDCPHTLHLPNNSKIIVCIECGALWVK